MRILVLGEAISPYMIGFAQNLKAYGQRKDERISIDVIDISWLKTVQLKARIQYTYDCIYNHTPLSYDFIESIPLVRGSIRFLKRQRLYKEIKQKFEEYDVIIMHGFWDENLRLLKKVQRYARCRTIGVFWGSDFYKRSPHQLEEIQEELWRFDKVIVPTIGFLDDINKKIRLDPSKTRTCFFGIANLDNIAALSSITSQESKLKLGINPQDLVITCGYNASPNQQHHKIIEEIRKVKNSLPEDYMLLFPMGYGGNKDYIDEVERQLVGSGLNYRIMPNFLVGDDLALLRKVSDIFIQVQITDSFSGSMIEYMFAKNITITGAWLPYGLLKERNVFFEEIESITDLSYKLEEVTLNFATVKARAEEVNSPEKFETSMWSKAISGWYDVMNERS